MFYTHAQDQPVLSIAKQEETVDVRHVDDHETVYFLFSNSLLFIILLLFAYSHLRRRTRKLLVSPRANVAESATLHLQLGRCTTDIVKKTTLHTFVQHAVKSLLVRLICLYMKTVFIVV